MALLLVQGYIKLLQPFQTNYAVYDIESLLELLPPPFLERHIIKTTTLHRDATEQNLTLPQGPRALD